jgi:hypothetical protein
MKMVLCCSPQDSATRLIKIYHHRRINKPTCIYEVSKLLTLVIVKRKKDTECLEYKSEDTSNLL